MKIQPVHIFSTLCIIFLTYSLSIYLVPYRSKKKESFDRSNAAEGRLVWQKYNCQSCHQLYGLGGYLGPDLTNIYSTSGKGEIVIKALIKSGTIQMPSFDLTAKEESYLIQFLKSVDASGFSDPRKFQVTATGMIEKQ